MPPASPVRSLLRLGYLRETADVSFPRPKIREMVLLTGDSLETKAVSDFKAARTGRPPDVCGWVRLLLLQEFQRLQPESTYSYCILKLHVLYFSPLPRIQTPGDLPSRLPTTHVSANRLEREVLVLLLSQVMNHKKPLRGLQSPSLHYPTLIPGGKYQRGKWILP